MDVQEYKAIGELGRGDKVLTARKKDRREQLLRSWRDLMELEERRTELLKGLSALRPSSGKRLDD